MQRIDHLENKLNIDSYGEFLGFMRMTESDAQNLMASVNDNIHTPEGFSSITVRKSNLSGRGLFSSKEISAGDIVSPMRTGVDRTVAGRFTNHAKSPSSSPGFIGGVLSLVANRKITKNGEITVNYFDVISCKISQGESL